MIMKNCARDILPAHRSAPSKPNHLLASCGFLPDFSPIEINGRLLGDGGLSANTPVEAVLDQTAEEGAHICFLLDLFSPAGHRPRTLEDAAARRWDLLFGSQTRRVLKRVEREHRLRSDLDRIAAGESKKLGANRSSPWLSRTRA